MSSQGKHEGTKSDKSLPATERIKSRKIVEELFSKGSFSTFYPYKVISLYQSENHTDFPQVLFTIPKRNFKKAVDRNRIRRQLKEIYRIHKASIFSDSNSLKPSQLAIIYIAKEKLDYDFLEKKLILVLKRLQST